MSDIDIKLELDMGRFQQALSQARLNLAVITFDPAKHPRGFKGHFVSVVKGMKVGDTVKLPDGVTVTKKNGAFHQEGDKPLFHVQGPHSLGGVQSSPEGAAAYALDESARHSHPAAVGGTTSYLHHGFVEQKGWDPRTWPDDRMTTEIARLGKEIGRVKRKPSLKPPADHAIDKEIFAAAKKEQARRASAGDYQQGYKKQQAKSVAQERMF